VLDWRKKSGARAQLQLAIEDTLDAGLPCAYAPEFCRQKCSAVSEHVYESYPERDVGAYVGGLISRLPARGSHPVSMRPR